MSSHGGSSSKKQLFCSKCNGGHDTLDCPIAPCSRCTGTRHTRGDCKSPETDDICFNCGDIGHLAISCKNQNPVGRCGICGGYGHGGDTNTICGSPSYTPMCTICHVEHRPQECPHRKDEYADWNPNGFDACTQCGEKGHVLKDCPQIKLC